MKFRLLYQGNDVRLGVADHLIGRSPDCSVCLDDPMVSRRHVLLEVTDGAVHLQDLESRNGVKVNGAPVSGRMELSPGDCLRVGAVDLVLVTGTNPRSNATTARERIASPAQTLEILARLAEKALAFGNVSEAEKILRHNLETLLSRVLAGYRPEDRVFEQAVSFAGRLACATRKGRWLGYVFEFCNALGADVPADVVEQLHEGAARMQAPQLTALTDYIALHRAKGDAISERQRFMLRRAEALLRQLRQ